MPIVDGQPVSAAYTNTKFIYKNADDSTTGEIALLNPDTAHIDSIQVTLNTILEGIGGDQDTVATNYGTTPTNTISSSDNHEEALGILARKFYNLSASGGHSHDGTQGGGAPISRVASLAASGQTPLTGAVTLSAGSNVTLLQTGQNIQITSTGGGGGGANWAQEAPSGTVNSSNVTYTLSQTPEADACVNLSLDGIIQRQGMGLEYTISGSTITMTVAPSNSPIAQTLWAIYTY